MTGVVLESKKHRLSQNQDGGWRLTINIHPNDELPGWLLTAPLGQLLGIVISALQEQPQGIDSGSAPPVADAEGSPASAPDGGSTPVTSRCPTPQAQARGAAEPVKFYEGWVSAGTNPAGTAKPKKHWDDLSPSQQAGIACNSLEFRKWVDDHRDDYEPGFGHEPIAKNDTIAARFVRWYCGVSSRADLDTNPEAAKRWRELYGMFQADTTYGERR